MLLLLLLQEVMPFTKATTCSSSTQLAQTHCTIHLHELLHSRWLHPNKSREPAKHPALLYVPVLLLLPLPPRLHGSHFVAAVLPSARRLALLEQ